MRLAIISERKIEREIISDIFITTLSLVFCKTKYSMNPPTFTMPVTCI